MIRIRQLMLLHPGFRSTKGERFHSLGSLEEAVENNSQNKKTNGKSINQPRDPNGVLYAYIYVHTSPAYTVTDIIHFHINSSNNRGARRQEAGRNTAALLQGVKMKWEHRKEKWKKTFIPIYKFNAWPIRNVWGGDENFHYSFAFPNFSCTCIGLGFGGKIILSHS